MWIYFVMVGIEGMLFLLSADVKIPEEEQIPSYKIPFYKMACKLAAVRGHFPGNYDPKREIMKMQNVVMVLLLGTVLMAFTGGVTLGKEVIQEGNLISRPNKGQGNTVQKLEAEIEELENSEYFEITLHERKYSFDEKQEILQQAAEELEEILLGENESFDEIRGKVTLPGKLHNGDVLVEWIQEPQGLLDEDGVIQDVSEEGELLQLTAIMTCEDQEWTRQMGLMLYPEKRTSEEQLIHDLQKQLEKTEASSIENTTMKLPEEIEGHKVSWIERKTPVTGLLAVLVLVAACFAYYAKESEIKEMEKKRRQQLLLDYSDLLFKLGLLLDTGLTIQNAFEKIAVEYKNLRDKEGSRTQVRYVYEEMLAACNEMKSGIPEAKAYERFGRRCGESCYIKLGTTLSGSLQKSSEGLRELLLEEAVSALEDRRQLAKKLGEEAGTKLLFPMILMLMVVLVILMVPAVLSF
ncbi:MAG: hypothetical protein ACI4EI_08050 [Muricoprocola sp.]